MGAEDQVKFTLWWASQADALIMSELQLVWKRGFIVCLAGSHPGWNMLRKPEKVETAAHAFTEEVFISNYFQSFSIEGTAKWQVECLSRT